jgi:hypothetical protein
MQHACDQPAAQPLRSLSIQLLYDGIIFVSEWQKQLYLEQFNMTNMQLGVIKNAIAPAFEKKSLKAKLFIAKNYNLLF